MIYLPKISFFCHFVLIASSLLLSFSVAGVELEEKSYAVICDAGSTGSRVFIFEFTASPNGDRKVEPIHSVKITPGISSFASHPQDVVDYFRPKLIEVANMIPGRSNKLTKLFFNLMLSHCRL